MLMAAATRLAVRQGSPHGLVLREVAREAGLNHNTFYRHFDDMDGLRRAIAEDFAVKLREGVRRARADTTDDSPLSIRVVGWLFEYAHEHADAFTVALREFHGPPGALREQVRQTFAMLGEDMFEHLRGSAGLSHAEPALLKHGVDLLIRHTAWLCLDYLQSPLDRDELLETARQAFETITAGVMSRSTTSAPR